MKRRVVITGIGAITPIGNNVSDYWKNLCDGVSGVDFITRFDPKDVKTKFAAEVKNYNPEDHFDRKEVRTLDLFAQFALVAADEAIKDSNINHEEIDKNRVGVVFGSGIGGLKTSEEQHEVMFKNGPQRISPFYIPMMIADIAAGHISIKYGFSGPNYATTSACATAAHALANAFYLIQRGSADIIVSGGSEAVITPMAVGGFNSLRAISTWNDRPKEASRPFDKERNGFVMGEGGGILILEELEHAKRRGAKIYAEIIGAGMSADAYHITAPAPGGVGQAKSIRWAIDDAGIKPEDVDYINAHGTSTPLNDASETAAIKKVFGDHAYKLVISSNKSMIGHLLGAAAAVEAIATVLTIKEGIIPPTINLTTPDPECDLNYCPNSAIKKEVNYAISNSFGFGGHNVSLLFKKYAE
ncbi:MAG TPA: beta-ketoacyl-ACP synthase II [Ignavibacteriales bacterium]|nr:beta-ketoacyl-ACP synthase II [Ignavibacteriales bacterium]HOL81602.1 beta-ketoacyl-ACP synthase II [Ignavibacteriales bacterium]HOM65568.1 beta-ketoacyl-ACP synthase II [Ignavibacteriales bacterium]HPD67869.1 beta-ketoacyl-ACP synthase II [Ignavibacteriales bacterium]HPP33716.1 beta-ketoacyl-ACP synthase II [Ignavibacteriales bacterium]